MKKQVVTMLIALVPAFASAKISDFNDMIRENAKSQSQLSNALNETVKVARIQPRQRIVIVENGSSTYNAPTKRLAFEKERIYNRVTEKSQFDRVASEISEAAQ